MKMKSFNFVAAGAMLLACAGALTSCNGGPGKTLYDGDITADTRGTTIDLWTGFGAAVTADLQEVLDDFTAQTGIKVTHTSKNGYENLQSAINLSASTSTYPNVSVGYPDHFAGYIDSNIQLSLDGFIGSDSLIPATRTGTATDSSASGTFTELPAFDYSDFYSSYLTENTSLKYKDDGTGYVMGIPFNKSTEVMVYNKTFFGADVIKTAGIALPTTWDEVKAQSDKILNYVKTKGVYGKVLASDGNVYATAADIPSADTILLDFTSVAEGAFYPLSYDSQANWFITGVRQWGGVYTSVDKDTMKGYIHFYDADNKAKTKDFLTTLNTAYQAGDLAIPATFAEASYCSAHFKIYQSLMNIGSSAGVSNCVPAGDAFQVACAPIPYKTADKKFVISQGTNLCIFDKGTNAERVASWKLVKFLSQVENGKFATLSGYFPTCKSALNSAIYQEFITSTAGSSTDKVNRSAATVNASIYSADSANWQKFVDPGFNGSSTVRNSVDTVNAQVFISKTDIDKVMSDQYNALADYVPQA
jgi:multiple sugar transport system substrate-binding protein